MSSLVQRKRAGDCNPNSKGEGELTASFFRVPVDSDGNALVSNEVLSELYSNNFEDFVCNPINALVKLGAKISTLADLQQMVDAKEGKILTKELLTITVLR